MKKLTEADVKAAVEQAIVTTGSGYEEDEREELDYNYLARILNDLFEQYQNGESEGLE